MVILTDIEDVYKRQAEPYSARDAFMDKIDVVGYNYVGRWRERAELLYDADREEHLRCV